MASRRSPVIGDTSTPAANGPDPFSASSRSDDVRPHGMAKRQDRPGGGGCDDLVQEQAEVGHVGGEIVDMALVAVGQHPVGQALAAPIHGDHGIAAAQQLAHDLGRVLFDELAPAGQDDDGAARSSRDVPAGIAQTRAGALQKAVAVGRHVGRSQIGRHGRRRRCRFLINHRVRRFGEGGGRTPAEIWAFWPSSPAVPLPFQEARL